MLYSHSDDDDHSSFALLGASCLILYEGRDYDGNYDDYNSDVSEDDDDYSSPTLPGASCLLLYEGGGDDDYDVDDYSHSDSAWCFLSPTL